MRSWWDPSQEIINSNWLLSQVTAGPNFQVSPIEWDTWPRAGAPRQYLHIQPAQAPVNHSLSGARRVARLDWGGEECFMTVSGDQGGKQTITQLQLSNSPPWLHSCCVPASLWQSPLTTSPVFFPNLITPQFASCCYHWESKGESVLGNPTDKFTLKSLVCCQVFGLTKYTQKYEVVKIQKCFSG